MSATRTVDAPLVPPSGGQGLGEVFRRRYLLRLLVRREISARYQGSFLGFLWSYINPLSQFFIYWFVIGLVMGLHKDVQNFAIHMFTGIIVVHFFTETFNAGTRSIVRNKALVKKMAMPREMFPVASMLVSGFHVLPQLVILLGVCLLYGWTPTVLGMCALVLALLVIAILGTALALLFSAANVFFRDFGQLVTILTNFVRFGVPMIYPYSMVHERFHGHTEIYLANPIAQAVLLMQRAFWVGTTDDPDKTIVEHMPDHLFTRGLISVGVCLVLLAIAQWVFSRLENKIPERL
ncbi:MULTISPECIES: ABC transporter permease [unclassified Nocardioides]|uniref:ABC transporter permease n=1 Tax=unclassified Nocardioides TaxID=2615069 RepID=UPI0006FD3434|nr:MULTISPECIES: ABC transporter permease [unclassified Nocardioides]KQY56486.1 ABC transporter [Nocardioides sp. Root140]KQZ75241.1 ABC transporter [Nocardioides sp. Root151]KRF14320.1 ABC transporter [Nocardioides sp. Soil796]